VPKPESVVPVLACDCLRSARGASISTGASCSEPWLCGGGVEVLCWARATVSPSLVKHVSVKRNQRMKIYRRICESRISLSPWTAHAQSPNMGSDNRATGPQVDHTGASHVCHPLIFRSGLECREDSKLRELVLLHEPRREVRTARRRTRRRWQGRNGRPDRSADSGLRAGMSATKPRHVHWTTKQVTSAEQDASVRRKALSRVCRFFGEEGRASQQL
jgi:hypothetical protein